MVTTACGELAQDTHAEHVRLVPVGDTCAFHDAMFRVATDLLNGRLTIDEAAVSGFRNRFDPKKEWQAWLSLIHEVTSNG